MISSPLAYAAATVFGAALLLAPVAPSASASRPYAVLTPHKAAIGKNVALLARNVPADKYFTMLVAVPDAAKPRVRRFVASLARSNSQGVVRTTFRMPILTVCGRASLYLLAPGSGTIVQVPFTLTGCTASKKITSPPPPPQKKSHK